MCVNLAHVARREPYHLHDLGQSPLSRVCFLGCWELYRTDIAQHLSTAGYDLYDRDDLSHLFARGVN